MSDLKVQTAYVFSGHFGYPGGAWCKTVIGDDIKFPQRFPTCQQMLVEILERCDCSELTEKELNDCGKEGSACCNKYPVLVAGDQIFALTSFNPDKRGMFPPEPDTPEDD